VESWHRQTEFQELDTGLEGLGFEACICHEFAVCPQAIYLILWASDIMTKAYEV